MSVEEKSSSKTFRDVGAGVGSWLIVGKWEMEGAQEGFWVKLGGKLGSPVGSVEIDGCILGSADVDGAKDGSWLGWLVGMADLLGLIDGSADSVGWNIGKEL